MWEGPAQKDIREINYKIEDIEKSVGLLVRSRRQEVITDLMENCFRRSIEKIRVFLAIDGKSSINDIAASLGILAPNVRRHLRSFRDNDLITIKTTEGSEKIYEKTSLVKRLLLDKYLHDRFREQIEKASEKGKSI